MLKINGFLKYDESLQVVIRNHITVTHLRGQQIAPVGRATSKLGGTESDGSWLFRGRCCQRAITAACHGGRGGLETAILLPHEACSIELKIDGIGRRTLWRVTSQAWDDLETSKSSRGVGGFRGTLTQSSRFRLSGSYRARTKIPRQQQPGRGTHFKVFGRMEALREGHAPGCERQAGAAGDWALILATSP